MEDVTKIMSRLAHTEEERFTRMVRRAAEYLHNKTESEVELLGELDLSQLSFAMEILTSIPKDVCTNEISAQLYSIREEEADNE